jgi:uncharacterized membrane protein
MALIYSMFSLVFENTTYIYCKAFNPYKPGSLSMPTSLQIKSSAVINIPVHGVSTNHLKHTTQISY